ncbi:MAG: site-2 protease family protein, partial [Crocinitomicaceae bacterium]|nr:site-2 protease family protein [Crocinitomicaceae bacterium]
MDFWIKAAQLLLSLSLLIVLHEFGHYIPARIFKTRVEKFYLFFNWKFSLFKKKIGDTEWGIGWIPLGGYVKIAGMIDESMDKEQMEKPPEPWEFRSKPAWQRLIIMLGGVTVNLLLGIIIYIFVVFAWGEQQVASKDLKLGMAIHPYMEQFGFHSGDNIIEIDGEKVMHIDDIARGLLLRGARKLTVRRPNGTTEVLPLPEDIDYRLFESGSMKVAGLRFEAGTVEGVVTTKDSNGKVFKKGDVISKIDGKSISDINFFDKSYTKKAHQVEIIREGEKSKIDATKAEFKSLLQSAPALRAGLKPKDAIIAVNNQEIIYHDEIVTELYRIRNTEKKETAKIKVLRGKDTVNLTIFVTDRSTIGFQPKIELSSDTSAIKTIYYGFGASIGKGIGRGYQTLSDYASQLKFIFTKKGASSLGGFGAIGGLFPSTWDWHKFWLNTAFISIILAFMNILPIPALDGGHVVFLLYEIITGK